MIRAVLFDAGATLLHPDPPVEDVYARELAADGARFTREALTRSLTRAWEEIHSTAAANRYGGVRGEPEFWRAFLDRVRSDLDGGRVSSAAFERLTRHFRSAQAWSVYADVVPTLDELSRRGLALAVVSNWDSYLPTLLSALGLDRFFGAVAVSAIEETGKPDSEIFHRACARVGAAPGEALHVGDSIEEDLRGAQGAGLSGLLLDRAGRHPEIAERITSLAELVENGDRFIFRLGRSLENGSGK